MDVERDAERELEDLERAGERVDRSIDDARAGWRAKQSDNQVPGAVEGPDDEDADEESDAEAEDADAESAAAEDEGEESAADNEA
jgi:hypothetical protein